MFTGSHWLAFGTSSKSAIECAGPARRHCTWSWPPSVFTSWLFMPSEPSAGKPESSRPRRVMPAEAGVEQGFFVVECGRVAEDDIVRPVVCDMRESAVCPDDVPLLRLIAPRVERERPVAARERRYAENLHPQFVVGVDRVRELSDVLEAVCARVVDPLRTRDAFGDAEPVPEPWLYVPCQHRVAAIGGRRVRARIERPSIQVTNLVVVARKVHDAAVKPELVVHERSAHVEADAGLVAKLEVGRDRRTFTNGELAHAFQGARRERAEDRAVKFVRSTLGDDVQKPARAPTVLGHVPACDDIDLVDEVHAQARAADSIRGIVGAEPVDHVLVLR